MIQLQSGNEAMLEKHEGENLGPKIDFLNTEGKITEIDLLKELDKLRERERELSERLIQEKMTDEQRGKLNQELDDVRNNGKLYDDILERRIDVPRLDFDD